MQVGLKGGLKTFEPFRIARSSIKDDRRPDLYEKRYKCDRCGQYYQHSESYHLRRCQYCGKTSWVDRERRIRARKNMK